MSHHPDRTLSVHAGRHDLNDLGVHVPPIDLSTTYPLQSLDVGVTSLEQLAGGAAAAASPVYARLHNPTVARFERAIAELEGAEEAVAFSSGMAAVTACLLAARERGAHVVALRPVYGGSDHLLTSGLLGMRVTWTTQDQVAAAIEDDTALVIAETPANPTLDLVDIASVVAQAGPVPVLIDSTFATPILQRPLAHGAAFVLHSATKFIGGHGDVVAGVVATSAEHAASLRRVRVLTGGVLYPQAGYVLHRGLQTLSLRVRAAQATATELARRLASHPGVLRVRHPSLPGCDPRGLLGRQLQGPGSILAFEVVGGWPVASGLLAHLRLLTHAVSLGSVDSLIELPAGLTHQGIDSDALHAAGVVPGLLRISVGLEDVDDLWADLAGALERAQGEAQ